MKRILFPTDFSEAAHKAFIYALNLARQLEAEVITLHVFNRPDVRGAEMAINLEDLFKEMDLAVFQNYKDAIPPLRKLAEENGFGDLAIKHVLEEGPVVEKILEVAERDQADLIVMGTTGASGLKKLLLGSIAAEVLENAHCPALVVPEKAVFDGQINHIAFTTSYKEEERKALDKVLELADKFEAVVHCINVDVAHTEFYTRRMEPLENEFSDHSAISFHVLEGTDIRETILSFLEKEKIDIVAMVTHKRNFLQELFTYSKTKSMTYHARTPILSWPAHTL